MSDIRTVASAATANPARQHMIYDANRKSTGVAYLLWFFLGGFGAHRFYLGQTGTAVTQLLLLLLGWIPMFVGWIALGIWLFVDLFLILPELAVTVQELDSMSTSVPVDAPWTAPDAAAWDGQTLEDKYLNAYLGAVGIPRTGRSPVRDSSASGRESNTA